jgi:hypothetical protein
MGRKDEINIVYLVSDFKRLYSTSVHLRRPYLLVTHTQSIWEVVLRSLEVTAHFLNNLKHLKIKFLTHPQQHCFTMIHVLFKYQP